MLRVAVVVGKMHAGGKKNLIMEYYRHIDKELIQFDFICDSDSNSIPEEEIINFGGRVFKISPYQNIFLHLIDLWKIFRKNQYQIMHAYDNTMNIFPLVVSKMLCVGVRISESISTGNKGEWKTYIKYLLRLFSSVGANFLVANSVESAIWQFGRRAYQDGRVAIFKSVIDVESNGYNRDLRNITRQKLGLEDKIVLGFIGRLESQKNPIFLIDIFREIRKKELNAYLVVIGSGSLEEQMLKKVDEYGLRDSFCFLGRREDIKQFYNAFDGFLLPSLYEGLPIVGIEAQAAGLPVFFSTEITQETSACDLATYINLREQPDVWAKCILDKVKKNMPKRRGYVAEVKSAGFDSNNEALRLQQYYFNALENILN